ncbi:MAG TPA: Ig-like domain-containing protein [Terriglobales bacterium]
MTLRSKSVWAAIACAIVVIALSTSCGNSNFFPSQKAIVALTISPGSGVVAAGKTVSFSATGTLGNNQTQDVTSQVTWSSSAPGIATISGGTATGVANGATTITASANNVTAQATLLVSNLTSITVTPSSWNPISSGGTQTFTAAGNDGTAVTNYVTWTTSDSNCATITSAGVATFVGTTTTCTITATLGSYSATASVSGL